MIPRPDASAEFCERVRAGEGEPIATVRPVGADRWRIDCDPSTTHAMHLHALPAQLGGAVRIGQQLELSYDGHDLTLDDGSPGPARLAYSAG